MPKTEFLQIRLSPDDRERLIRAATASHLEPSTWARQAILRAVEASEETQRDKSQGMGRSATPRTRSSK